MTSHSEAWTDLGLPAFLVDMIYIQISDRHEYMDCMCVLPEGDTPEDGRILCLGYYTLNDHMTVIVNDHIGWLRVI